MGEVGRTDQFQHCQSADDVIMPIEKDGTLARSRFLEYNGRDYSGARTKSAGVYPSPTTLFLKYFMKYLSY
jgi:hypothetical protein